MNQVVTTAIILSRIDYGEADRILTLLTPDHGKLRLMAKGVRRVKSKMAGGIELFSVSNIGFIKGRGDMGTLVSTRLVKHYGNIVSDIDRTMLGYNLIKKLNKITEDHTEAEYFNLMQQAFDALDNLSLSLELIQLWFNARLLMLGGHTPNLQTDTSGNKLLSSQTYAFDFDTMCPRAQPGGHITAHQIKFLRLVFAGHTAAALGQVNTNQQLATQLTPLINTMLQTHLTK